MNWIEFVKRDENAALKEIYRKYRLDVVSFLQREFSCQEDEAADIFQVAVVIFYDNIILGKLTTLHSDIKSYIKAIAKNKALELIRAKTKQQVGDSISIWISYVQEENPDEELNQKINKLNIALEYLGEPCKSLLNLFYYKSNSMEDITLKMGYKNTDTAKNQKYKCLKRLQKLYFNHIQKITE